VVRRKSYYSGAISQWKVRRNLDWKLGREISICNRVVRRVSSDHSGAINQWKVWSNPDRTKVGSNPDLKSANGRSGEILTGRWQRILDQSHGGKTQVIPTSGKQAKMPVINQRKIGRNSNRPKAGVNRRPRSSRSREISTLG